MHKGSPCRHRVFVEAGFWSVAAGWRALDTLMRGLLTLSSEGWGIYSTIMEYETLVGLSGNPVVDDGLVDLVGRSRVEQPVRTSSGSARTQAQGHSPHPTHARMSRQSHDRKAPEQNLSTAIATHDSHILRIDVDTGLSVAIAHRHPHITHARATQLLMYTCRQSRWS